jgi:signal transduction histidine kinase
VVLRIKNLLEIRLLHQQLQQRIARDIHDGLLQDLGALLMTVELCAAHVEAGATLPALADLQRLRAALSHSVRELRGVVKNLRPSSLETYGLAHALTVLVQPTLRAEEPNVLLENDLLHPLPSQLEVTLFYLVQEGLTNIHKHAAARRAVVQLTESAGAVHLILRDDGCGFVVTERLHQALATGHIGLAGMYERVKLAGGHLTIESSPDQGTIVHCVLPIAIGDSDHV